MILKKSQCGLIEKNLRLFNVYKRYIRTKEDIIINSTSINDNFGGNKGKHSDETCNKALLLYDSQELEITRKWVQAIENTIENFKDTLILDVLKMRYFEEKDMNYIIEKLNIERTTCYRYREDIILYTMLQAVQLGLIRV